MTDHALLYIIGAPGAGKTTALRHALGLIPRTEQDKPVPHIVYPGNPGGIQLGAERGKFAGTDAMAMNIQPAVLKWLETRPAQWIVAEGDRLANDAFFAGAKARGYDLSVVYLDCPPEVAEARRLKRAANGIPQNRIWVKGRETKVRRLAELWAPLNWWIDAGPPVDQVAQSLLRHPVLQAMTGNENATAPR